MFWAREVSRSLFVLAKDKMHTRHVDIQSLFLEIQEVKWRCTTVDLIPDRARTCHLRGSMAEYIPNILDIRAMAEVNIYWCHLSIFSKGVQSWTKVYSGHHLTEFGLSCEPPVTIRRSSRGELIKLRKSILCNNNHRILLITFSDTVQGT